MTTIFPNLPDPSVPRFCLAAILHVQGIGFGKDHAISTLIFNNQDRRAIARAEADWQNARGDEILPSLSALGIGDVAGDWRNRFLICGDRDMSHAVFITCGDTLQSEWDMERMGRTLEDTVPKDLRDCFAEGCEQSVQEGRPVAIEGSYKDEDLGEVLFRCIMMPVRTKRPDGEFIFGAYSHKIAN